MIQDKTKSDITRPFDAAFQRLCAAEQVEALHDELSTLLHQHYRLCELIRSRRGANGQKLPNKDFNSLIGVAAPGALGAMWVRGFNVHDATRIGALGDTFSDFYTNMYGTLVWQPVQSIPGYVPDKLGRSQDYEANLSNKPVPDTIRSAFDKLASFA